MFHATMSAAIDGARTLAHMDELARSIWQAHAAEAVNDDQAQALAEALHARRSAVRGSLTPVGIPVGRASLFPPKRPQRSQDRVESLSRRRHLAASGPMPPALASRFTTGQLAVLRIVSDEFAAKGVCGLCIDAIAARAGVCRRLAQAALRLAEGDGLLVIQERRHQGRKNGTNLVRIISREWRQWIARRGASQRPSYRVQTDSPHGYTGSQQGTHRPGEPKKSCRDPAGGLDESGRSRIVAGRGRARAMR